MRKIEMTPVFAVSTNFLQLEQPYSVGQLWNAAEIQARSHCDYCRVHGFTAAYAASIVGDETTIGSWDAAAEVITCAFVDLYQQADSCIAGGF